MCLQEAVSLSITRQIRKQLMNFKCIFSLLNTWVYLQGVQLNYDISLRICLKSTHFLARVVELFSQSSLMQKGKCTVQIAISYKFVSRENIIVHKNCRNNSMKVTKTRNIYNINIIIVINNTNVHINLFINISRIDFQCRKWMRLQRLQYWIKTTIPSKYDLLISLITLVNGDLIF